MTNDYTGHLVFVGSEWNWGYERLDMQIKWDKRCIGLHNSDDIICWNETDERITLKWIFVKQVVRKEGGWKWPSIVFSGWLWYYGVKTFLLYYQKDYLSSSM